MNEIENIEKEMRALADRLEALKVKPQSSFYKGQQVLMWDYTESHSFPKIVCNYDVTKIYPYINTPGDAGYKHCKPDPDAVFTWVKHDGSNVCPVDEDRLVLLYFTDGECLLVRAITPIPWSAVIEYAIINRPEWL